MSYYQRPIPGQPQYAPQYAPYGHPTPGHYAYYPHGPNQAPYGYPPPPPGYAHHPPYRPIPPPQAPPPPPPKEPVPTPAVATTTTTRGPRKPQSLKGAFTKELASLLVAFGDDNPAPDTVAVLEEILIDYIADVCQTAVKDSRKSRLTFDDLRKALSRPADAQKLARMEELIFLSEQIKKSRSMQFGELGEVDNLPPGV